MIRLEVWLYGPLARFAGSDSQGGHACLHLEVPEGTSMGDLLRRLGMPSAEKGITFIDGRLTDMPGLGADKDWIFRGGERVGLFHRRSMWPFQYRNGAAVSSSLRDAMRDREAGALCHSSVPAREGGDLQSQVR